MKHYVYKIALCISIFTVAGLCANREFLWRSQSQDTTRELVGWTQDINLFSIADYYGAWALTPEYTASFNAKDMARILFGPAITTDCRNQSAFRVTGSQYGNRQKNDLLADYFGLPVDFASTVTLKPSIKNFILDGNFYLGLDPWLCGMWLRMHAPIVYTSWNLNMCETIQAPGATGYAAGYFAPNAVPVDNLNKSFSAFTAGRVPVLNSNVAFQPLTKDLIRPGAATSFNLSDIQMAIGLNFWQDEYYHLGGGLRTSMPTGTRIGQNPLLFAPVIGNGHHWEAGALLTGHSCLWQSESTEQELGFYFELDATYLFATRQCRTFDILGAGRMSRYMLLEQMTPTILNNLLGNAVSAPTAPLGSGTKQADEQFVKVFTPAVNIANASLRVSIPIQIDGTALLHYGNGNFEFDCGWNLWATAGEELQNVDSSTVVQSSAFAVKGDSYVFGFDQSQTDPNTFYPVALSASQTGANICQGATIYSGLDFNGTNSVAQAAVNPNVDNALYAYGDGTNPVGNGRRRLYSTNSAAQAIAANHIKTSIQPILLSDAKLDLEGAKRSGFTNKIFAHASWHFDGSECWTPYIGVGGMAEFASNSIDNDPFNCSCSRAQCSNNGDCGGSVRAAISQWGIWIKTGAAF